MPPGPDNAMSVTTLPRPRLPVHGQAELVRQLRALGIDAGDMVLVRVDFGKIGLLEAPGDRTLIASLREAVGPRGTIVALTHSPYSLTFRRDHAYIYEPATAPCVTGRFAQSVLKTPGAFRSQHPTCSMAALGPAAHDLLGAHDHCETCFAPMQRLIARGGKMLLVGCAESSPGFSTIHHAYDEAGLGERSLLSGLIGCYFRDGEDIRWFAQRDVPGCSRGYHKFYPLYRDQGLLRVGPIGGGEAYLVEAARAYPLEREVVGRDPRFALCDDARCFSCRGTKLFNKRAMPRYYLANAPRFLRRLVLRRK